MIRNKTNLAIKKINKSDNGIFYTNYTKESDNELILSLIYWDETEKDFLPYDFDETTIDLENLPENVIITYFMVDRYNPAPVSNSLVVSPVGFNPSFSKIFNTIKDNSPNIESSYVDNAYKKVSQDFNFEAFFEGGNS